MPKPVPAAREAVPIAVLLDPTPARQPNREDSRRIRDALDIHYDEGGQYYGGDMTDSALAEHLKVPRVWVSNIREQFYGPDTNFAAVKSVAIAVDLEKRLTTAIDDAMNRAADMEALRVEVREFLASTGKAA